MFFDDDEVSISLFGDREVVPNISALKRNEKEMTSGNRKTTSNNVLPAREMKFKNHLEQTFAETYCSDYALQSVLERTSMSYQNPASANYNARPKEQNDFYPSSTNANPQPISDLQQDRNKRVRTQLEVPNSVYCTHQGLDTILNTSSMAYHCNNSENLSLHRETPTQESFDDDEDEYLLAFGRQIDAQQKNQWVEETISEMCPPHPPPPPPQYEADNGFDEQYLDFPPPKVYLEGIEDFDVFTLFPISDEAM
jgi:hypothetical protein